MSQGCAWVSDSTVHGEDAMLQRARPQCHFVATCRAWWCRWGQARLRSCRLYMSLVMTVAVMNIPPPPRPLTWGAPCQLTLQGTAMVWTGHDLVNLQNVQR